jgi:hypothetical protein
VAALVWEAPLAAADKPLRDNRNVCLLAVPAACVKDASEEEKREKWVYLSTQSSRKLRYQDAPCTLYWGVPEYPWGDRQIAYIHSTYTQNQPVYLYRSEVKGGGGNVLPRYKLKDHSLAPSVFAQYHGNGRQASGNPALLMWHSIEWWQNIPGFAPPNPSSFQTVCMGLRLAGTYEEGTERILFIQGGRPIMSWIPFETRLAGSGQRLSIWCYYSKFQDPALYRYKITIE